MNIIGISAHYHDSACCLMQDGKLICAVEEERLSRNKHDSGIPWRAFRYCLSASNLTIADIDCVAYYENPQAKLSRKISMAAKSNIIREEFIANPKVILVEEDIRNKLGYQGKIEYSEHHLSHAAASYYFSGFKEAAILTVDGVGEWASTSFYHGIGHELNLKKEVYFPNSLGLLYSTFTSYLGFAVNDGEYKVMGLAPYGSPVYLDKVRKLVNYQDGVFTLDMDYFGFLFGNEMYSEKFISLFGKKPREPESKLGRFHRDVARSIQVFLEEILIEMSRYLYNELQCENLCLSGGVALNCVANSKILNNTPFKKMFIQPAAGDSGSALGAAAVAHGRLSVSKLPVKKLAHVYFGPRYQSREIRKFLNSTVVNYSDYSNKRQELLKVIAGKIAEGRVIGWFSGAMEFGPRALGGRSILADPRNSGMREKLNMLVKKRESFRPFAPAVMEDKAGEHFSIDHSSPFMLETCQVTSQLELPAITHVDGSARVQTVSKKHSARFYKLIEAFNELTGCPILINTSFNVRGEPIVCSYFDALLCFIGTDIDYLVLEHFIISKNDITDLKSTLHNLNLLKKVSSSGSGSQGLRRDVYTFL